MKEGNLLAYNDYLADKIRNLLHEMDIAYTESAHYGQLNFLKDGKFFMAVMGDNIRLRLRRNRARRLQKKYRLTPINELDRRMKDYVTISPFNIDFDYEMRLWIEETLYHPQEEDICVEVEYILGY